MNTANLAQWAETIRQKYATQWQTLPNCVVVVQGLSNLPHKRRCTVEGPDRETYTVLVPLNPLEGYRLIFVPQLLLNIFAIAAVAFLVASRSQVEHCKSQGHDQAGSPELSSGVR